LHGDKMTMTSHSVQFTLKAIACLAFVIAGCDRSDRQANESNVLIRQSHQTEPIETAARSEEPNVQTPRPTMPAPPAPTAPQAQPQQQQPPGQQKQTFALALKFAPQDTTKYDVTVEAERSVQWEGPASNKPSAFKGGHTGNRIEVTFTQRIKTVDDKGDALAEITIESLKYVGRVRDNVIIDFDSSRQQDQNEPLAKLIGQAYTIELSPAGQVLRVVDVNQAQSAVRGVSAAHTAAVQLLSAEAVRERHTISAIDGCQNKQLVPGDTWSNIKTFSFGMMGSKTHERVYTFKGVSNADSSTTGQIALIEMSAIPSSQTAEDLHKDDGGGLFTKMFDNSEAYTGRLKLDLTAGTVVECIEKLSTEWVAAEPPREGASEQPAALKMAATRSYHIVRIP
jgi:hypothetical protein